MVHLARWQRIAGWCGIFFFLLTAVAFFGFATEIDTDMSAAQFVDRATQDDAALVFAAFAVPAMLLWLWFAAGMRERLSWGMGWTPVRAIGWASAIAGVTLIVASLVAQGSLLVSGPEDLKLSDEFIRGSWYALGGLMGAAICFLGMWLFASGLAAVAWGGVPAWWGWPAMVGGIFTIGTASVSSDIGALAFAFWWAWSLVGAVWLAFADDPSLDNASKVRTSDRETVTA